MIIKFNLALIGDLQPAFFGRAEKKRKEAENYADERRSVLRLFIFIISKNDH